MNYIISNNECMPVGMTTDNFERLFYKEFFRRVDAEEGFDEVEGMYFDIDGMTEEFYNDLIKSNTDIINNNDVTFKFFRYKTKPFIKEPVELVDVDVPEIRKDCLNIQLAPDVYTDGNILVSGMPGQGKSTLLKNMAIQLHNKGTSVTFISDLPVFDKSDIIDINTKTVDVAQFARIVEDLEKEMMYRYRILEQNGVNHASKLNVPIQPKALIIDGFDFYMHSNDYKSLDIIKHGIDTIAYRGRPVAILIVISCNRRPSGSIISSELKYSIMNNIVVGKVSFDASMLMFDKEVDTDVPFGKGIYQDGHKDTKSDDAFSIFNIEDVKNYK